jgi:hypothetical protein
MLYLMDVGGFLDGSAEETFEQIAWLAKKWQVTDVDVEKNYGDGMWAKMLRSHMGDYRCSINDVQVSGAKEKRILDVLDPVIGAHRLVVHDQAVHADYLSTQGYPDGVSFGSEAYQLFYQMANFTAEKGALLFDDRLDALALGVGHFSGIVEMSPKERIRRREERQEKDFVAWLDRMTPIMVGSDPAASSPPRTWMEL